MRYKMILLDMDGTLLDDKKNIHPDVVNALNVLNKKGVTIGIATGRRYSFAKPALKQLGFNALVFSNSGNTTWDMENDKLLDFTALENEHFNTILQMGYELDMHPILHVNMYYEGYDIATEYDYTYDGYKGYIRKDMDRHIIKEDLSELKDTIMIMCYPAELSKVKKFQKMVHDKYSDNIHSHITMSLTRIGPLLEISEKEGTKWHAALKYAKQKGIKPDEIIAIGDDGNDIDMLEHSGVGIAMKNAIDPVKKAADIVLDYDNNQAGVARGLQKVYGKKILGE